MGKLRKNTVKELDNDVDTRTDGVYILLPASIANSKEYRWDDYSDTLEELSLNDLPLPPDWLIEALDGAGKQSKRSSTNRLGNLAGLVVDGHSTVTKIPDGQRNAELTRHAGVFRARGLNEFEIRGALAAINESRCNPPLDSKEVDTIAWSVAKYDINPASEPIIVPENAKDPVETLSKTKVMKTPEELLDVPGFVGDVMSFTMASAPYPNKPLAFAGALALQSFLAARKVRDLWDNRTNIYLLGLANSASGKDWPRKVNYKVLQQVGLERACGDTFASGEGLEDSLARHPSMLYQTDEIDSMLQSINKSKDGRQESIMRALLTIYSSANGSLLLRAKAGKEDSATIHNPSLTLFGTAIPSHYYDALSERMLTNGFFARTLIIEAGMRGEGNEPQIISIPTPIEKAAHWWSEFNPGGGNLDGAYPEPATVEYSGDAHAVLSEGRREAESEYSKAEIKGDNVSTTVWGRVDEQTRKLALIYAVSADREAPVIDGGAATWARAFVTYQAKRMLFMALRHVSDSPFQAECQKFKMKLGAFSGKSVSHSVISRKMRHLKRTELREVIDALIEQGFVSMSEKSSGGRLGRSYQLLQGVV